MFLFVLRARLGRKVSELKLTLRTHRTLAPVSSSFLGRLPGILCNVHMSIQTFLGTVENRLRYFVILNPAARALETTCSRSPPSSCIPDLLAHTHTQLTALLFVQTKRHRLHYKSRRNAHPLTGPIPHFNFLCFRHLQLGF